MPKNDDVILQTNQTVEILKSRYRDLKAKEKKLNTLRDDERRLKLIASTATHEKEQIEAAADRILKMNIFQFMSMKRRYRKEMRLK